MNIRPACVSDLPAMAQIVTDAYSKYIARMGKPPGPMLDDYPSRIRTHTPWVIENDGAVAGLIVLIPRDDISCSTTLPSTRRFKDAGSVGR